MRIHRHHRWLHPKHLSYIGVTAICLFVAPFAAIGLGLLYVALRLGRWYQRQNQSSQGKES